MANWMITPILICHEIRRIAKRMCGDGNAISIAWHTDIRDLDMKFRVCVGDRDREFSISQFDLTMAIDPFSEKYLEDPVSEVLTPSGHDRAEWC